MIIKISNFIIYAAFVLSVSLSASSCSNSEDSGSVSESNSSTTTITSEEETIYIPADGEIADDFAANGEFLLNPPGPNGTARDAVTTSDGSIYVVGYNDNSDDDVLLFKLKENGSLDTSFGNGGYITRDNIAGGNGLDRAFSIDLAPDGDLLVGGYSENGSTKQGFLWKLSTSGVDNTAFGSSGTFLLDDSYKIGQVYRSKYDSFTENIFIVAAANSNTIAWRVLADGSGLDNSFSDDGVITISSTAIQPTLNSDENGKLFVVAYGNAGGNGRDALSWILDTNGNIDAEYGNPLVHGDLAGGTGDDKWYLAIPYDSNRLLLAGFSTGATTNGDEVIARVNMADGTRDATFGTDGVWKEDIRGDNELGRVSDAVVQNDGSIIAALELQNSGEATNEWDVGIIKLNAAGNRDMSFASGTGILMLGGEYTDRSPHLIQQPNGRILVLTSKGSSTTSSDIVVWAID